MTVKEFLTIGAVAGLGLCMLLLAQIGVYSLFIGCLFFLSDLLIGSTVFAWNYILLGGLVVFFIKLLFSRPVGVKYKS